VRQSLTYASKGNHLAPHTKIATILLTSLLTCATWRITVRTIKTIRHEGLKQLFEEDDPSGVNAEHVGKLKNILATLNAAPTVAHMDMPGFKLHPLKGQMKGFWAVTVRANWRVIFRFDGDAEDVDYVDYH
jgi:toxin HigB-1